MALNNNDCIIKLYEEDALPEKVKKELYLLRNLCKLKDLEVRDYTTFIEGRPSNIFMMLNFKKIFKQEEKKNDN